MRGRRWSGWGASVRGPEHQRTGLPNQDAWAVRQFHNGVAAVVSDGLGSCRHSDVGAQAACRAVVGAAKIQFRHDSAAQVHMPTLVQHLWEITISGHTPADCSATCLFVASRFGDDTLLAQLGDGLIAACGSDGAVDLLMPDKSESFANLTVGLASDMAARHWRTIMVPESRYSAFVLCTDGIADDLEPSAAREFAWEVCAHYRHCSDGERRREVRRWLRAWPVLGHSDDKTIACIYRNEGAHG